MRLESLLRGYPENLSLSEVYKMKLSLKLSKTVYVLAFLSTISVAPTMALEKLSDDIIVHRIHFALFEDPRVRAADITINSIDGIVTIEGTVRTLAELRFVEAEVKKIRGVLGLINKLLVKPAYRLDVEIRQELKHRIINSSTIQSENLGVRVENGIVFLSGIVGSSVERDEVSLLAEEVLGVKGIENHIEVTYKVQRPDIEIQKDVMTKLSNDVYLFGLHLTVAVKNGYVTLSGEVGNVFQKERAEKDAAALFNVMGVNNALTIIGANDEGVRTNARIFPDSIITKTLEEELRLDARFDDPKKIRVQARQGVITLTGTVQTFRQKRLAQQDVQQIAGVKWINNLLQVKGVWRDDEAIALDIRNALTSDYSLIKDRINFYVVDGVVTLKGNVTSNHEKSRTEKDIERIIGVKDIKDYIIVDWLPLYSDDDLKGRIFDRFTSSWETWQLVNKIVINVKDGRATLTGTVDTWAQLKEAGSIAEQTDGIRSVDNQLVVHK
jgi:osmotically-inducible protein OsmY